MILSSSTSLNEVWVFSDSQAAIQRLQTVKKGAGQLMVNSIYQMSHKLKEKSIDIHINWVPAHMNIEGNELADKAAKRGTELVNQVQDKCVSLSFIKRQIKENCLMQ